MITFTEWEAGLDGQHPTIRTVYCVCFDNPDFQEGKMAKPKDKLKKLRKKEKAIKGKLKGIRKKSIKLGKKLKKKKK